MAADYENRYHSNFSQDDTKYFLAMYAEYYTYRLMLKNFTNYFFGTFFQVVLLLFFKSIWSMSSNNELSKS